MLNSLCMIYKVDENEEAIRNLLEQMMDSVSVSNKDGGDRLRVKINGGELGIGTVNGGVSNFSFDIRKLKEECSFEKLDGIGWKLELIGLEQKEILWMMYGLKIKESSAKIASKIDIQSKEILSMDIKFKIKSDKVSIKWNRLKDSLEIVFKAGKNGRKVSDSIASTLVDIKKFIVGSIKKYEDIENLLIEDIERLAIDYKENGINIDGTLKLLEDMIITKGCFNKVVEIYGFTDKRYLENYRARKVKEFKKLYGDNKIFSLTLKSKKDISNLKKEIEHLLEEDIEEIKDIL